MLNRSASLAMSTCVLKALPGKLDIKRHSPSILYVSEAKVRMKRSDTIVQLQFFEKIGKLYRVIKKMVNPFQEETADLLTLDTKIKPLQRLVKWS